MKRPVLINDKWAKQILASAWESRAFCMALFCQDESHPLFSTPAMEMLMEGMGVEALINPELSRLFDMDYASENDCPERIFSGIMNIGKPSGIPVSIQAEVFRLHNELLIIGEIDVMKMHEINNKMARMNQQVSILQRNLIKEKLQLDQSLIEISQANQKLKILNQEKNHFLNMAAHDLRSPVSTALSFVDLLRNSPELFPPEKKNEFLKTIEERLHFSLKLMSELLDISKIEKGSMSIQLENACYIGLLNQVVAFHSLVGKMKNISLELQCREKELWFFFDRNKLEQVLNNLMSNAIKYSPENTHIQVRISHDTHTLTTTVADQGLGLHPHELEEIFVPYKKASARPTAGESSTGLGLAIARKIIESHGGKIWAESSKGHGSAFHFSLPMKSHAE